VLNLFWNILVKLALQKIRKVKGEIGLLAELLVHLAKLPAGCSV
jgi:predicted transcriptional regulator